MTSPKHKAIFCILVFIVWNYHEVHTKSREDLAFKIRFRSLHCQSDNKTIVTRFCYLKPISKKIVTINIGITFLVPITNPFYFRLKFYYRYGLIFRQILDTNEFDYCNLYNKPNINPLAQIILKTIELEEPDLLHECPYFGDLNIKNFTANLEAFDMATMMFPQGIYKIDTMTTFNGSLILKTVTTVEVKSPLKESFG